MRSFLVCCAMTGCVPFIVSAVADVFVAAMLKNARWFIGLCLFFVIWIFLVVAVVSWLAY